MKTYRKFILFSILATVLGLTFSCDVENTDQFEPEYVVESYMYALEPLPEIRLSQTVGFGKPYNFEDQAISNANVSVTLAGINSPDIEFRYLESAERGVYVPENNAHLVQPLRSYSLNITFPDDDAILRSTTLVPDTFQILTSTADSVVFGSSAQLEIDLSSSFYPGRQNIYVFSTESFEPTIENFTPFFGEFFDEEEDDIEDFRINESPPFNEENYDRNPDGSLTIKLPWIAVTFFGQNQISANAVDDNIYNFITSVTLQTGGSTLSPGEIPNILDPIEGGVGIFGSYARVTKMLYVKRQ